MTKIYEQAKDVPVANNVIYAKGDTAYKYVTCDGAYTASELKDAFLKGAVIDIPIGYYGNEDHMLINPLSYIKYDGDAKGYLNFTVPNFGKNKYPGYITDEKDKLTKIGSSPMSLSTTTTESGSRIYPALNAVRLDMTGNTFGIEFGENTHLYSVLSDLGNVQKTISIYCGCGWDNTYTYTLSCGEDSKTYTNVYETRMSLTTTGNIFRIEISNAPVYPNIYFSRLQVNIGGEATEYEEGQPYGTEDLITIGSAINSQVERG